VINVKPKTLNLKLFVLICVHLCLSVGQAAAGDAPQLQAQLAADQIYFGESVIYQVTLRNVKDPSAPDLSAFAADFQVTPQGDQSLNQNSVFIVNGRMTQQVVYGHAYNCQLTPKRAGVLTVPAPTALVDGSKLTGPTLSLRVTAAEKQDLALMEISVRPAKVCPTKPFEVTLRILIKPLPDAPNRDPLFPLCMARQPRPPALQVPWVNTPEGLKTDDLQTWLQKRVSNNNVGFTINNIPAQDAFAFFERRLVRFDLSAGREIRKGLDGTNINYFVYELKRTFTAKQEGDYRFGPATLKGLIVNGVGRGEYSATPVYAMAEPQSVGARLPLPRPPSFCGGIGSYRVTATASPMALRVGDPVTLTLAFEALPGSGALDLISAPDVSANAKLAEDFDIIDRAPTGEAKGGVKRFAYGLRVKKIGPGIPPLTVSVFNPDTERFVDIATEPIKLNTTESPQLNAGDLVGALPAGQSRELRSHQEGIFQNVVDVAELGNQRVRPFSYIVAVALMCLLYGGLSLFVASWRRKSGDVAWQRRQRALPEARKALAKARVAAQKGKHAEALRAIRAALVGLLADMRNAQAAGITAQEARTLLVQAGVSAELAAQAVGALETIEALEYGSAAAPDLEQALQTKVEDLLPRLRRELDLNRR